MLKGLSCYSIIESHNDKTCFCGTVLPAKSDSEVMFCLQIIRDLELIDYLCINPFR